MSANSYSIEFARSGRAKCRKCKGAIEKGALRIVTTIPGEEYETKQNHHVECFSLPRKLATGAHKMSVEDFVNSMLEDTSVGEILPSMAEEIIAKIEKAASSGKKAKGEGNKMLDSLKRAHEGDESETKRLKLDPKLVDAYGIYAKHKNDALKDVLKWNRQMVGGTRNYLFVKVVDGHVRGRLARCAVCQGGRLKLQEDGQTVTCNGNFDEDSHMRIDCAFKCPVADAPRLQPWYSVEPSEEEKEAMEKLDEEVKGGAGPMASDDSIEDKMKEEASNIEWKLVSKQGIRAATAGMVSLLRKYDVDVPSDEIQAKQKVGPVIAANRAKSAAEIIPIAIETFGFIEDKKAKAEKKAAAVTAMVKVQSNAALAAAFQELAELYFKEGNRNAGVTYNKLVNVVRDLDFEITEDIALGLGKGKTKVAGVGKSSAEKMHEFCQSGKIQKLEDKRAETA